MRMLEEERRREEELEQLRREEASPSALAIPAVGVEINSGEEQTCDRNTSSDNSGESVVFEGAEHCF